MSTTYAISSNPAISPTSGASTSGRRRLPTLIAAGSAVALSIATLYPITQSYSDSMSPATPAAIGAMGSASPPGPHWSEAVQKTTAASGLAGLLSLPVFGQVKVNADIGRDNAPYNITATATGFSTHSPTYRFGATFDGRGLALGSGLGSVNMSLSAVGRGTQLSAPPSAEPKSVASNAITYTRGPLTETYRNGPLGIAQSFDLAKAPAGQGAGELTLALQIANGTVTAAERNDQAVIKTSDGTTYGYRGLFVRDSAGKTLPARLQAAGSTLFIRVDDKAARYPISIDPFVYSASTTVTNGPDFGAAVAARRAPSNPWHDPRTFVMVGDPEYNGAAGRAYQYTIEDGQTDFQGPLIYSSPQAGSKYGTSVDLGADIYLGGWINGNEILATTVSMIVGAPGYDATYPDQGAVFVHTSQYGDLEEANCEPRTATIVFQWGEAEDHLGASVATNDNGRIVFAGMPDDNFNAILDAGAVAVAQAGTNGCWPSGTVVSNLGLRHTSPAENDHLGSSLATDSTGRYVVAGAPGDNGSGTAQVFQQPDNLQCDEYGDWQPWSTHSTVPDRQLYPSNPSGSDEFGRDVAMSADATTVVVGAPNIWNSRGSAFMYLMPSTQCGNLPDWDVPGSSGEAGWLHEQSGTASVGDRTGQSVAISDDGAQVYVGSPHSEDSAGNGYNANEGQVFLFEKGTSWYGGKTPTQKIYAGSSAETPDDHFGADVDAVQTAGSGKDPLIAGRPDIGVTGNHVEHHVFQ